MRPIAFSRKNENRVLFHYTYKELREFVKRGREFGDCGAILVRYNGDINIFRGYGTIENPSTTLFTISMRHHRIFDGERRTPEELVAPPVTPGKEFPLSSDRMVFIDNEEKPTI